MLTNAAFSLCVMLGTVAAQADPALYSTGQFPSGKVYRTDDLSSLVGRELPQPSYLVGNFIYLGLMGGTPLKGGTPTFSTFDAAQSGKVRFGNIILRVEFRGGFPATLDVGRAIAPDEGDPLTLIRVESPKGGRWIFVTAESWSENF